MSRRVAEETRRLIEEAFDSVTVEDSTLQKFYQKVLNFQGKKAFAAAEKIIKKVTSPDDLIYDPFFGTGSFLIAASRAGRKIIGTDIDNYVYAAVKTLLSKFNKEKLQLLYHDVEVAAKEYIMDLYTTECCGHKNIIDTIYFDPQSQRYHNPSPNREFKDGNNVKMLFKCPICGRKAKPFQDCDAEKLQQTALIDTSRFPHHRFITNSRINITSSTGADRYDTNFVNRQKAALLKIQDAINGLEPCIERDILEFALVFSVALSRIVMYGSSTNNLYHVVPFGAQEMNVWEIFEGKYESILAYKEELKDVLQSDFSGDEKIEIHQIDFQSYLSKTDLKFKIIYTDPPYTDQVPYLEYQQYYRDWLREFYNHDQFTLTQEMLSKEIVVTNAPSRTNKNLANYLQDIDQMFDDFSKHLEDKGFLFLTIKLGNKAYFNVLTKYIEYAKKHGLEFVSKRALEINDPTLRKQAAYLSTTKTQILVCFQKLPKESRYWYIGDINIEDFIKTTTYRELKSSENQQKTLSELVNAIKRELWGKHQIPLNEQEQNRIAEQIKKDFLLNQNGLVQLNPDVLYIGLEDKNSMFIKLYDVIPVIIKKLLQTKGQFTIDDLYYEIAVMLCDYDQELFDVFLKEESYKASIQSLIDNYCEESNHVYVRRKLQNIKQEGAIDISCLDGYEFEDLVKKLLQKEGYRNVVRIGGAGDRGVDLVATDPVTSYKVIFQCKRWISNVGSEPIQRLHSMMILDKGTIKRAVCITTSNYTKDGKDIAEKSGVETINGSQLLQKLEQYFPGSYYHGALNI